MTDVPGPKHPSNHPKTTKRCHHDVNMINMISLSDVNVQ